MEKRQFVKCAVDQVDEKTSVLSSSSSSSSSSTTNSLDEDTDRMRGKSNRFFDSYTVQFSFGIC